jgi:hypothetical protein
MATTTTNFGWDIPQSTDLVKDGATAIAALGQDIDTAFVDFKGGTTGQVLKKTSGTDLDVEWGTASSGLTLINTTSFSGVTTQSINDVFSATYDIYYILANVKGVSGGSGTFRLRASGSDLSSSVYTNASFSVSNTSINASRATGTSGQLGSLRSKDLLIQLVIGNPFRAEEKSCFVQQADFSGSAATGTEYNDARIGIASAVSYTGFTLISSVASSLTGKVSVYGYSL